MDLPLIVEAKVALDKAIRARDWADSLQTKAAFPAAAAKLTEFVEAATKLIAFATVVSKMEQSLVECLFDEHERYAINLELKSDIREGLTSKKAFKDAEKAFMDISEQVIAIVNDTQRAESVK